tara:strand:- start:4733 stop:5530 length:798 start_codon:yes stop_codon:yes gene_type:complete
MDPKRVLSGAAFLILILAIFAVIYMTLKKLYNPFNTGILIIDKPVEITHDMVSCVDSLPDGSDHTYSFWMFVSHWSKTPGRPKIVFKHKFTNYTLNVSVGENDADLEVFLTDSNGLKVSRKSHMSYYSENDNEYYRLARELDNDNTHVLQNLPIQSWNHITLSVYDKTIDLYLNGKLARTFVLADELQMTLDQMIQVGSVGDEITYSGFLSKFRYYPRLVSPHEIYKIYLDGPASESQLSYERDAKKLNLNLSLQSGGPTCATAH